VRRKSQFYLPPTPACTPQPQAITALWLVLVALTHEGMARLSLPGGWLQEHLYNMWIGDIHVAVAVAVADRSTEREN